MQIHAELRWEHAIINFTPSETSAKFTMLLCISPVLRIYRRIDALCFVLQQHEMLVYHTSVGHNVHIVDASVVVVNLSLRFTYLASIMLIGALRSMQGW